MSPVCYPSPSYDCVILQHTSAFVCNTAAELTHSVLSAGCCAAKVVLTCDGTPDSDTAGQTEQHVHTLMFHSLVPDAFVFAYCCCCLCCMCVAAVQSVLCCIVCSCQYKRCTIAVSWHRVQCGSAVSAVSQMSTPAVPAEQGKILYATQSYILQLSHL